MQEMQQLIRQLQQASTAYYKFDQPIMTDKQYDALYDQLEQLEHQSGVILSGSPTQKVQGQLLDGFVKVPHSKPMLSAQKTKNVADIEKFCADQAVLLSWKLDGLTLVLSYDHGTLQQGVTRGDGQVGEDVTQSVRMFGNIPLSIPYQGQLQLRGEGVLSYTQFAQINEGLEVPYSSARNLASGTVRQLNTQLVAERGMAFVAFQLVQCDKALATMEEQFAFLACNGFQVVEHQVANLQDVAKKIERFDPKNYDYPVDGLIVSYNDVAYGETLGQTGHHPNSLIALKWQDETKETTLVDIELNPTRTGRVSLTAVFEPVEIDGAVLRRATLHNVDIMQAHELGIGDTITVYRSNMVIPAVDENLTRSNSYQLPTVCPCCGSTLEIKTVAQTRELFCPNETCPAKQVRQFAHFVSKHGMNIEGLSEQTLEKLIDSGFIHQYQDIFTFLDQYAEQMMGMDGFGEKSVVNLRASIEKSRHVRLDKFLTALGIPTIGRVGCKEIAKHVDYDWHKLQELLESGYDFTNLNDFGEIMNQAVHGFYQQNKSQLEGLTAVLTFEAVDTQPQDAENPFFGKTVVATGKLEHFTRDSIKETLESLGAKVASSVSAKTDYLLAGEKAGSKLQKAQALNVAILTEDQFINMAEKSINVAK